MNDLREAARLIKVGDRAGARQILVPLLKAAPNDERAWLMLAHCAASIEERNRSIQRVLLLDPDNATALKIAERYSIPWVEVDSDPTQLSHPTIPLRAELAEELAKAKANEPIVIDSVQSRIPDPNDVVIPDPFEDEEEAEPPKRRRRRWLPWSILAFTLVIMAVLAIALLDSAPEAETDFDRTSNAIYQTNTQIWSVEIQRATAISLTLIEPPTNTLDPNALPTDPARDLNRTATSDFRTGVAVETALRQTAIYVETQLASTTTP